MKNALLILASLVLAVAGFVVGRTHHGHLYKSSGGKYHGVDLLIDEATGKLCNPLRPAEDKAYVTNAAMDEDAAPIDLSAGLVPQQVQPIPRPSRPPRSNTCGRET